MPVIPGTQPGQVLQAGSPVPITSPEESRMQGTAVAQFGAALFQLGDALDKSAKEDKRRLDRAELNTAVNKAEGIIIDKYAQRLSNAPIQGDYTGAKQVAGLHDDTKQAFSDIADQIGDPLVRREFFASIEAKQNDYKEKLLANEIAKRAKATDMMEHQYVASEADLVRKDSSLLGSSIVKAEIAIRSNTNIPAREVEQRVLSSRQSIVNAAIDAQLQQGETDQGAFERAKAILVANGKDTFDSEEYAKMSDHIDTEAYKTYTRQNAQMDRNDKLNKRAQMDNAEKETREIIAGLSLAGNNENARQPWLDRASRSHQAGIISTVEYDQLTKTKTFTERADDRYEVDKFLSAVKSKDFSKAMDEVRADITTGNVSLERGRSLIEKLNAHAEMAKKNPEFMSRLKAGQAALSKLTSESLTDIPSGMDKRTWDSRVYRVIQEYTGFMLDNPGADFIKEADRFAAKLGTIRYKGSGKVNSIIINNPAAIDRALQQNKERKDAAVAKGLFTDAMKAQYRREQMDLTRQRDSLLKANPLKSLPAAEQKNTKGVGTR